MISAKKLKRIRLIALITALVIAVAVFLAVSAYLNKYHIEYMTKPTFEDTVLYRVSTQDAADESNFSQLDYSDGVSHKVAENSNLILYLYDDYSGIRLYDKIGDTLWDSKVSEKTLGDEVSESYRLTMQSFLSFSYIELTSSVTNITVNKGYSYNAVKEVTAEKINSGVRVKFNFTELNIKIAVDIILDGDALVMNIPNSEIFENEEGVDELADIKTELEKEIENIRSQCEKIKTAAANNSSYSDSKKKAIELKINAVLKILVNLKDTAGTGNLKIDEINNLYTYIDDVIKLTSDMGDKKEKLEEIKAGSGELMQRAELLSKGKSTGIVELSVLPYFGAQTSSTDGYVFYPDGNGAISYFNRKHPAMSGVYGADVFGNNGDIVKVNSDKEWSNVLYPVFGIKLPASAFAAIITEGEADAKINFSPCQTDRDISNAYASFYFRKSTTMVNSNGGHTYVYDTKRTKNDREIRFVFLNNGSENYSGMAVAYRTYLENTNQLNASSLMQADKMPIGLEFYMGRYGKQNSIFNKYITVTKYSDIEKMLTKLKENGLDNQLVSLTNWSKDSGLKNPESVKPAQSTGGVSGLKELASYAKENGVLLSLEMNNVWVNSNNISFSQSNIATVKAKSQMTRTANEFRCLNPAYVYNTMVNRDLKTVKDYGVTALSYLDVQTLYYDYNKYAVVDRGDTEKIFSALAEKTKEELGYYVTSYAPQYHLSSLDWLTYMPIKDSEYLFQDENVPFYQIVLHGSVAYTSSGHNYLYNEEDQKLKNIEYGFLPFYYLTAEDPFELRNNGISGFYSTMISDWEDKIIDYCTELSKDLESTWNVKIKSHTRLSETLSVTEYENGKKIYVNYATTSVEYEGIIIGAKDYKII